MPSTEWGPAVAQARNTEFDLVERIGLVAGVVFVAYVLRFDSQSTVVVLSLPVRYLFLFLAAVPLLVLVVGPFFLQRSRRGLDNEILLLRPDEVESCRHTGEGRYPVSESNRRLDPGLCISFGHLRWGDEFKHNRAASIERRNLQRKELPHEFWSRNCWQQCNLKTYAVGWLFKHGGNYDSRSDR